MHDLKLQITDDFMVDFVYDEVSGLFELTETLADVVRNNIIMSITIRKGEILTAENFGSARWEIKQGGDSGARELERIDAEALQWIISLGRAKSIDVKAWPAEDNPGRLDELITATLPDGETVPFETFLRVV